MDGDVKQMSATDSAVDIAHARGEVSRPTAGRPAKTVRWFIIVGLLLALVLGGLYGFNRFREQAIAAYFASNKPPPAAIAAVTAAVEAVPRFASGIGSLEAVHQVTITPEIGGRVTAIHFTAGAAVKAGDPLVQLNDAPERGDLANFEAQGRMASIALQRSTALRERQYASQEAVDKDQMALDQARAGMVKTQAIIEKTQRSPISGAKERVDFLKLAWDAIGSEFGSRHTQYEMFYAGAPFVTCAHSFRTYDWPAADALVQKMLG